MCDQWERTETIVLFFNNIQQYICKLCTFLSNFFLSIYISFSYVYIHTDIYICKMKNMNKKRKRKNIKKRTEKDVNKLIEDIEGLQNVDEISGAISISNMRSLLRYRYSLALTIDSLKLQRVQGGGAPSQANEFRDIGMAIWGKSQIGCGGETIRTTSMTKRYISLLELRNDLKRKIRETMRKREKILAFVAGQQIRQKEIIREVRAINSDILKIKKENLSEEKEALGRGEFEGVRDTILKKYFDLFGGYIAEKSDTHRAILFVETEYDWDDDRGYRCQTPTGYILCGIDDNEEEWKHEIIRERDYMGHFVGHIDTVETAMGSLWHVSPEIVHNSTRQGDILFHPNGTKKGDVGLVAQDGMLCVAEHHVIRADCIQTKKISEDVTKMYCSDAVVEHTSHEEKQLKEGGYTIYQQPGVDVD